ncbi:ABC transporter substrate-binding protein [Phycicoccus sonneratiae]|uniref:Sugar ABC transporter substrate-binding protein n=1 Tax=Phycicoccus sonneratiae TaxID=2807628 RepID=A0ABS2CNE7_9MICO|nr:sugar ABC transporter substrate-binding protein [Phycicoccus sonneraticus]MBM6401402.1 sugar ABC transporter substrate-binding protein [Phycicoccus sonneraticus]
MTRGRRYRGVLAVGAGLVTLVAAGCGSGDDGGSGGGGDAAKVAFLMPDTGSTRYELHDRPGFEKRLKELCPTCQPLYNNADGSADKQQQQFNSALAQGAKVIVLDPVDSAAAASLVNAAHSKGVKVIAYDRPIPDIKVDFYVSFDNEKIGQSIATSLLEKVKAGGEVPAGSGLLLVNGSPTDAAAGLIKKGVHSAVDGSGIPVLAEYDTIEWKPENAQKFVSGQISRFGDKIIGVVAANDGTAGGSIAAFKAGGVNPNPPVSGNDATVAGLQLIIAGDQWNTISKPSEIVGGAAAEVAVKLINGETPETTGDLFGSPSKLYDPTLVTAENLKAEIVDKKINTVAELCTSEYAAACQKLGIS